MFHVVSGGFKPERFHPWLGRLRFAIPAFVESVSIPSCCPGCLDNSMSALVRTTKRTVQCRPSPESKMHGSHGMSWTTWQPPGSCITFQQRFWNHLEPMHLGPVSTSLNTLTVQGHSRPTQHVTHALVTACHHRQDNLFARALNLLQRFQTALHPTLCQQICPDLQANPPKKYGDEFHVFQCFPMFSNVFQCVPMCSNVFQCPPMCSDVLQCPPICSNLFQCVPMFQNSSIRNADTPLCFKLDLKLKKEHRWVGSLLCLYPMCKIILLSLTATSCPTYITKSITISSALSTTSSLLCPKTFHKNFDFTIQRKPSGTSPWGFRDLEQAAEFLRSRVKLGCGTSLSFYSSACLLCLLVPCGDDPLVLGGAAGRTARWQDMDGYGICGICGISYSIYSISGPCRRRTIGSRFSLALPQGAAGCPGLWGQGFQMTSIDKFDSNDNHDTYMNNADNYLDKTTKNH